ncbi:ribosomal protein L22 [Hypomontagnella submonticulosa]|nr:ribosomal protein L22 [Hypomontagnella submonticulosa]
MSLHLPARRVATAATTSKPSLLPLTQRRHAWFNWGRNKSSPPSSANTPFTQELTRREREEQLAKKNMDRTQGTSIFDEELADTEAKAKEDGDKKGGKRTGAEGGIGRATSMREHMERAMDPDPRWRVRFLKRKVVQMVQNRNKPLSRDERIKRSEKQLVSASPALPTSTKKLVHLSHQIVGKTVDEAITQMRFSKKKMAREVKWQLEEARDRAIAARGMGLGSVSRGALDKPTKIQTKDGKWIEVNDPTALYVDQSWVTKGPWRGVRIQYHARSRMSQMWRPTASISVVLKEEKTRIRQHDERVEKQAKKAPWVHLPNRPVTAQRQYYSW